jgi:glycosyltransferase involved in cell wall biosynthesis
MAQRRILFLTQILPYPLDAGAKVRAYYMLRHLAERHRVTLASLVRPTDRADAVGHLAGFCETVNTAPIRRSVFRDATALLTSLATGLPALILRDRSAAFRDLIGRLVAATSFDAIHVDQIKTAQHVAQVERLPRLVDLHNVYHEMIAGLARLTKSLWRKRLLQREAKTMARYECRVCRDFNEILAVTERDAAQLRAMIGPARPVTAIPICVDPSEAPRIAVNADSRALLSLGAMFYPPNVDGVLWFVREILPRVRREVPDVRLRIVGPRPDRSILRAADGNAAIQVVGYAEDAAPGMAASAALVVPLRAGGGMRVKILDAMARGLPVVSTRLGAEGIAATDGENILLADGADAFAQAVVRLLRDVALRRRLAQNARQLIESRYDWRRRYDEVDAVYERLFAAGDRSP